MNKTSNNTSDTNVRSRVMKWARDHVGGRVSATCVTDPSGGISTWDVWEKMGSGRNRVARVRVSPGEIEVID